MTELQKSNRDHTGNVDSVKIQRSENHDEQQGKMRIYRRRRIHKRHCTKGFGHIY